MKYSEVVDYIYNIPKFTKKNSMDHTRRFMELLENPDKKMKIIHVAGTNGKGSTCAYMNAMLCSEGYKVGLFTSPHLEEMTERIRMNGVEVHKDEFVDVFEQVIDVVREMEAESLPHPTFFEFLFGMAMVTFARNQVDYGILETGLGGRLDATNVIAKPVATVITSIGLDHEAYLGNTIEQIAGEKAGIIKSKIPVIYDGSRDDVSLVVESKAKELQCICKKISDSAYEIIEKTEKDIAFYMNDAYDNSITWKIKNRGSYQVSNAALAITTLQTIMQYNHLNERKNLQRQESTVKWQKALEEVIWAGRMEEVEPGIYVDGAHNVAAIEAISKDMSQVDVVLFSAVSDKNYAEMVEVMARKITSRAFIVTTIDDTRGIPAKELVSLLAQHVDRPIYCTESIEEAWNMLRQMKSQEGKALCIGSLYLVGMIKKHCVGKR